MAVTPMRDGTGRRAVATGGVMLEPHVVDKIENSNGTVVRQIAPTVWRRTMTPQIAATVTQIMIHVVDSRGTGSAARIPGIQVAGKTGTAETGPERHPDAWFMAFAPARRPQVRGGGARRARRLASLAPRRPAAMSPRRS